MKNGYFFLVKMLGGGGYNENILSEVEEKNGKNKNKDYHCNDGNNCIDGDRVCSI